MAARMSQNCHTYILKLMTIQKNLLMHGKIQQLKFKQRDKEVATVT